MMRSNLNNLKKKVIILINYLDFFKSTIDLENTIPEIDSKTSFKKDKCDESNQNDIESNRSGYVFSSIKTLFTNYFYSKSKQEATNTYTNKIPGITTIRKYFDVELDEIKEKLKYSLMPYSPKFQQLAERNPDLYGPFWIFATLVYIVAVAGNISNYIDSTTKDDFRYEFDFIPSSAFYVFLFFIFLDLWIRFRIPYSSHINNEVFPF